VNLFADILCLTEGYNCSEPVLTEGEIRPVHITSALDGQSTTKLLGTAVGATASLDVAWQKAGVVSIAAVGAVTSGTLISNAIAAQQTKNETISNNKAVRKETRRHNEEIEQETHRHNLDICRIAREANYLTAEKLAFEKQVHESKLRVVKGQGPDPPDDANDPPAGHCHSDALGPKSALLSPGQPNSQKTNVSDARQELFTVSPRKRQRIGQNSTLSATELDAKGKGVKRNAPNAIRIAPQIISQPVSNIARQRTVVEVKAMCVGAPNAPCHLPSRSLKASLDALQQDLPSPSTRPQHKQESSPTVLQQDKHTRDDNALGQFAHCSNDKSNDKGAQGVLHSWSSSTCGGVPSTPDALSARAIEPKNLDLSAQDFHGGLRSPSDAGSMYNVSLGIDGIEMALLNSFGIQLTSPGIGPSTSRSASFVNGEDGDPISNGESDENTPVINQESMDEQENTMLLDVTRVHKAPMQNTREELSGELDSIGAATTHMLEHGEDYLEQAGYSNTEVAIR
jgi:hypothetical protein